MNLEILQAELSEYCQTHQLTKFAPEEIFELLQDGEKVDWVMSMLMPAEQLSQHTRLVEILTGIRQHVYQEPEPAPEAVEETSLVVGEMPAPAEPEMEQAELEQMALSMLPPGVDPRQFKKFLSSQQGELMADFAAFCQEKGAQIEETKGGKIPEELRALQDEWMKTPRQSLQGKTPQEVLGGRALLPQKVETVRRAEPKVGRNDPCPCGSGKKYKKCHGS